MISMLLNVTYPTNDEQHIGIVSHGYIFLVEFILYTGLIWSAKTFALQPCWRVFVLFVY